MKEFERDSPLQAALRQLSEARKKLPKGQNEEVSALLESAGMIMRMAVVWEAARKQVLDAKPDPEFFDEIKSYLDLAAPGVSAIQHIAQNNISVLFFTAEADFSGDYSYPNTTMRISRSLDALGAAGCVEHETRHDRQYRDHPELFSTDLDAVDYYAARKLTEYDAVMASNDFLSMR